MAPWSVMARWLIPRSFACLTSFLIRLKPSRSEYSVCTCRCAKSSEFPGIKRNLKECLDEQTYVLNFTCKTCFCQHDLSSVFMLLIRLDAKTLGRVFYGEEGE